MLLPGSVPSWRTLCWAPSCTPVPYHVDVVSPPTSPVPAPCIVQHTLSLSVQPPSSLPLLPLLHLHCHSFATVPLISATIFATYFLIPSSLSCYFFVCICRRIVFKSRGCQIWGKSYDRCFQYPEVLNTNPYTDWDRHSPRKQCFGIRIHVIRIQSGWILVRIWIQSGSRVLMKFTGEKKTQIFLIKNCNLPFPRLT